LLLTVTYRIPLSRKATAWAIRKQKTVSKRAMMHLDAMVNQNSVPKMS
jgi:hypothetical protein